MKMLRFQTLAGFVVNDSKPNNVLNTTTSCLTDRFQNIKVQFKLPLLGYASKLPIFEELRK